jgi:hypothetical protein
MFVFVFVFLRCVVLRKVRISRQSPCGTAGGGGLWCGSEGKFTGGWAAIGGKQHDVPGSYTITYRLKTSSS